MRKIRTLAWDFARRLHPVASANWAMTVTDACLALGMNPSNGPLLTISQALQLLGYEPYRVIGKRRRYWARPKDIPIIPLESLVEPTAPTPAAPERDWVCAAEGAIARTPVYDEPDANQVEVCARWLSRFAITRGAGRTWKHSPRTAIQLAREVSNWVKRTRHCENLVGPEPDISPGAAIAAADLLGRAIFVTRDPLTLEIDRDAQIDVRARRVLVEAYQAVPPPGDPRREHASYWLRTRSMIDTMATLPSWVAKLDERDRARLGITTGDREIEPPRTDMTGVVLDLPTIPDDSWHCLDHWPRGCMCLAPNDPDRVMMDDVVPIEPNTPPPEIRKGRRRRWRVAPHMVGMHVRVRDEREALKARGEAIPPTAEIVAKILARNDPKPEMPSFMIPEGELVAYVKKSHVVRESAGKNAPSRQDSPEARAARKEERRIKYEQATIGIVTPVTSSPIKTSAPATNVPQPIGDGFDDLRAQRAAEWSREDALQSSATSVSTDTPDDPDLQVGGRGMSDAEVAERYPNAIATALELVEDRKTRMDAFAALDKHVPEPTTCACGSILCTCGSPA